jgi:hypothetical protein
MISLSLIMVNHHIGRLLAPGRGTARELQFTSRFLFQKKNKSPLPAGLTSSILKVMAGMGGQGGWLDWPVSDTRRMEHPRSTKRKKSEKGIRHPLARMPDPLFGLGAHHS